MCVTFSRPPANLSRLYFNQAVRHYVSKDSSRLFSYCNLFARETKTRSQALKRPIRTETVVMLFEVFPQHSDRRICQEC